MGKKVVMGWHMPHMIDNMIGEATAVAQTIQVAGEKLRGAHLASNKIKAATVKVFTNGNQVLQHIDGRAAVKGFRQETFRKAIQLVCKQSHELGCIPGLDVKLELFWVPGHAGVDDNDITGKAAKQILRNPRQALSREAAGSLTSTSTPLSPNSDPTGETVTVATVEEMAAAEEAIAVVEDVSGATEDTAAAEEEEVSATGEELATFELAGGGTLNGDGAVRNDYLTQLEVDIQLFGEMEEALWREFG
ncbi:hypothetical protein N0V85_007809 [Neurospora sp. IMI 360204]|nr:hypothetical protein N0V85_007809 [Neurospora sp. IMI 360204]